MDRDAKLLAETRLQHGIRAALERAGRSAREVSLAAGLSESAIKNVLQGKARSPRLETLKAIADELGTTVEALSEGAIVNRAPHPQRQTSEPRRESCKQEDLHHLMARRLKAALFGYTNDPGRAAEKLGVSPEVLQEYTTGRRPLDDAFLTRFAAVTGCPLAWIFLGKITSEMHPRMAARIALADPDLVEEAPPEADPLEAVGRKETAGDT